MLPAFVRSGVCLLPGFACFALVCSGVCVLPAFACSAFVGFRVSRAPLLSVPAFACSRRLSAPGFRMLRSCLFRRLRAPGVCVLRRLHVPVFVGSRFLPEPAWRTPLRQPPRKTESGAPLSVSGLSLPHGCAEVCRGCQSPSAKEWITTPERSLGSNHVVFGGMMLPVSAMLMSCCIETG